jgi:ubiquinol-cytochrome c reductase iron-sulfur subunit
VNGSQDSIEPAGHDDHDNSADLERIAPGLPAHRPRRADIDPRLAKRAERQVALMFTVASLCVLAFLVFYVIIPKDRYIKIPILGTVSASNFALGLLLGLALFLIGAAGIHWSKKLMSDEEEVAERHSLTSSDADREATIEAFGEGVDRSGFAQRKLIRRSFIGAMALLPLPAIILLRDLGPLPEDKLRHTIWAPGVRVVTDPDAQPVRPAEISLGSLVQALPANLASVEEADGNLNARAKSAIFLVRMAPDQIQAQQGVNWDYQGILAFSRICTHVGCPIGLYEQKTHHMLCPCHQSTFDLSDGGKVLFGPAARSLPQLAITVDSEGYIVAQHDFTEPVGPSFWERG